jgi:hypothetical protein
MSDDYRGGPYTPPSEPPLTFDPRRPVRGRGPVPIALIVSCVVLFVVVAGGVILYRGGFRTPGAAPQPVGAPVTDVKTAPPPEAQPADAAAGLSVYKDANGAPAAAPKFTPPPETPAPRPAPVAVAPAPPVAAVAPAAKPVAPATVAVAKPVLKPPVSPTPPKPVAAVATAAPATTGVAAVQIGAFSTTWLADKGWNDAAAAAPAAMAGKGKKIEPVDVGGSTLYRTTITGFATRAAAVSLCEKLKAAGKTCFVK